MRHRLSAAMISVLILSGCFGVPEPEMYGFAGPVAVLRHGGSIIAVAGPGQARGRGHLCPLGHRLARNELVIAAGFPATFELEVQNSPGYAAAEAVVTGGTLTKLGPQTRRATSVLDGQTVEMAIQPLSGIDNGVDILRFSIIPVTGSPSGGPETVEIAARVHDDEGGTIGIGSIIAGSEARLCGPI